ncbi:predicted protein [Chaetomium globosum CBS 148.51]|uniref:Uncharacterized protein n=1 Tax=Chaetomium globosum (strain ATCC 6205 / CBS 148.51 / DSM 1962 / NBRC 6347 / NRRL 1970) TaxID=306901 RepID=Q2H8M7_CHAGB|nr:uncharacterized protein CHGG_03427 [Chaetomium globosum CBS 148.51]EAQ91492.1 predicted protein [Chaetomium globosum CBS 148.51]
MSALDVAQEKMIEALHAKILQLEAELRNVTEALGKEKSKNWDLTYQRHDLQEEVWRLKMHLSHSMTISDWEEGSLMPQTALENALELRIKGLERRVKELDDKVRNRDLRVGYIDGTDRVRSRSITSEPEWTQKLGCSRSHRQAGRVWALDPPRVPWALVEAFAGAMRLANVVWHRARKQ